MARSSGLALRTACPWRGSTTIGRPRTLRAPPPERAPACSPVNTRVSGMTARAARSFRTLARGIEYGLCLAAVLDRRRARYAELVGEKLNVEWFHEMVDEPRVSAAFPIALLSITRYGEQADVRSEELPQASRQFVTVHDRKTDVENADGRSKFARRGERARPIVRDADVVPERRQPVGKHLGGVLVVVHDEDACVLCRFGNGARDGLPLRRWGSRQKREAYREFASFSHSLAMRSDRAAVHLDEVANDGKAEPEPAFQASVRAVALEKQLENTGKEFGRDAHPRDRK